MSAGRSESCRSPHCVLRSWRLPCFPGRLPTRTKLCFPRLAGTYVTARAALGKVPALTGLWETGASALIQVQAPRRAADTGLSGAGQHAQNSPRGRSVGRPRTSLSWADSLASRLRASERTGHHLHPTLRASPLPALGSTRLGISAPWERQVGGFQSRQRFSARPEKTTCGYGVMYPEGLKQLLFPGWASPLRCEDLS